MNQNNGSGRSGPTAADRLMISFGRALSGNEHFFQQFYERLIERHPEVAPFFAKTNFARKAEHLRNGLNMVIMFDTGDSFARETLTRIAHSHGASGHGVDQPLYQQWSECLLQLLAESDPAYDEWLAGEWRRVLEGAIDFIAREAG